jgi:hypothetical protein
MCGTPYVKGDAELTRVDLAAQVPHFYFLQTKDIMRGAQANHEMC